ncbi:MAG: DNA recombination protein RmuC [Acidobacteria bacterium]|nr:DNA recombination protein RmuC [Acidobacteriota bacterium]
MDPMLMLGVFLAGVAAGAAATWLYLRAGRSELAVRLESERAAFGEKLKVFEEAQQRLSDAFKALAADALRGNNEAFLQLARETLGRYQEGARQDLDSRQSAIQELVKPLSEQLKEVDRQVTLMSAAEERLRTEAAGLRAETANLATALRAPKVRGRWGEIQLRRVVEMAGMLDHCDFREQEPVATEEGRLRPDLVVYLPNHRRVVVDAKVSLKAYLEAVEATDEAVRTARLREHAAQVRAHLARLSGKAYWEQFDSTPEFVVMFLPGEVFFSAALEQDPALIESGVQQQVLIATPTTLIALLRAVAYGWRQEALARHAQTISQLGQELYERLRVFVGHFERLRKALDGTVSAYNDAVGSLEARVLVSARRFKELGAAGEAEIQELEAIDRAARKAEPAEAGSSGPA